MFHLADRNAIEVVHSEQCLGTPADLSKLRSRVLLMKVAPTPDALQFAIWQAARVGHRKCLRLLLQHTQLDNELLLEIVFLTTHSESLRTLDLGLRLMELLCEEERRSAVSELLANLVLRDKSDHLQHLMRRLGVECHPHRDTPSLQCNTAMSALFWRRHECLRLLLRHGHTPHLAEDNNQPSLILAWASLIPGDSKKEIAIVTLLFEFGSNVWERDAAGLLPMHRLTTFPLEALACGHAPPESRAPLVAHLQRLMRQPRSLMSASRLLVTTAMGHAYEAKLHHLRLPKSLIDYLMFEELRFEDQRHCHVEEESDEEGFDHCLLRLEEQKTQASG